MQYSNKTFQYNDHPIETVGFQDRVKCFTFFNYISKLWTDMKFNLDKITIIIQPNFNWLAPHFIEKYFLAVHSPKMIPEFKIGTNFIEIKPGISTVTYCKMKIDRKYESNCNDYEQGDSIRSDCVTICAIKRL